MPGRDNAFITPAAKTIAQNDTVLTLTSFTTYGSSVTVNIFSVWYMNLAQISTAFLLRNRPKRSGEKIQKRFARKGIAATSPTCEASIPVWARNPL